MTKKLPQWLIKNGDEVTLLLFIQPKASKTEIVGEHDNRLKIRIMGPPVDGAANKELIAFLKKKLKVDKNDIEISAGQNGRRKSVKVKTNAEAVLRGLDL